MCRALHAAGHEAVAAGIGTAPSVFRVLSEWADRVVYMDRAIFDNRDSVVVYCKDRHKQVLADVGRDRWSNPYHPELRKLCEAFVPELTK